MSLEVAISMEPIKEKLRRLVVHMPGENDAIYLFGKYLAEKLNPELTPSGFFTAAELFLQSTSERSHIIEILRTRIPDIADAICPEDFARDVKQSYEQYTAAVKKQY